MSPNATTYENLIPMAGWLSKDLGVNMYLGNYRGVGYSGGSPNKSQDLVVDGEAMVQYLLSKGVPSENIMIHGWSLGGAVATEVAALHQEKGHEMKLSNDRSFDTLLKEISHLIPGVGRALAPGAFAIGWRFNPGKSWKTIGDEHKVMAYHKDDKIIPYKASLHRNRTREAEKENLKDKGNLPKETVKKRIVEHTVSEDPEEKIEDVHGHQFVTFSSYPEYRNHIRELLNLPELEQDTQ